MTPPTSPILALDAQHTHTHTHIHGMVCLKSHQSPDDGDRYCPSNTGDF